MRPNLLDELINRPVQKRARDLLQTSNNLRPQGGNFSDCCGLNVESFFNSNGKYLFMPLLGSGPYKEKMLLRAKKTGMPIVFCEDSYLRAATVFWDKTVPAIMRQSVSLSYDTQGLYFDATRATDLEDMLNSHKISQEEIMAAENLINTIVENKITKYNNQPIITPSLPGRKGKDKILVIDQDHGDASIRLGMATDEMFGDMLTAALDESPDADILVKTHPDSLVAGGRAGNLASVREDTRIHKIMFPINPYSILEQVSKVYVCTSTFGFEALLCGKPVRVFGMPWYAGWGITDDIQKNKRRISKRTIPELFHVFYMKHTKYADPFSGKTCNIEAAINILLRSREQLFKSKSNI